MNNTLRILTLLAILASFALPAHAAVFTFDYNFTGVAEFEDFNGTEDVFKQFQAVATSESFDDDDEIVHTYLNMPLHISVENWIEYSDDDDDNEYDETYKVLFGKNKPNGLQLVINGIDFLALQKYDDEDEAEAKFKFKNGQLREIEYDFMNDLEYEFEFMHMADGSIFIMGDDDDGGDMDFIGDRDVEFSGKLAPTPIPGAVWLLGSGLVGLVGIRRKLKG